MSKEKLIKLITSKTSAIVIGSLVLVSIIGATIYFTQNQNKKSEEQVKQTATTNTEEENSEPTPTEAEPIATATPTTTVTATATPTTKPTVTPTPSPFKVKIVKLSYSDPQGVPFSRNFKYTYDSRLFSVSTNGIKVTNIKTGAVLDLSHIFATQGFMGDLETCSGPTLTNSLLTNGYKVCRVGNHYKSLSGGYSYIYTYQLGRSCDKVDPTLCAGVFLDISISGPLDNSFDPIVTSFKKA